MTRWESIVTAAREIDWAFAKGRAPDPTRITHLARAVLDFQQHLAGSRGMVEARPIRRARGDAAAD